MAKVFYTEREIDELKARGVTSLDLTDNVVLTDLAVERAFKQGIRLNRVEPSAPPKASFSPSVNLVAAFARPAPGEVPAEAELKQKIKSAVLARLEGTVDAALLDAVISKVLAGME